MEQKTAQIEGLREQNMDLKSGLKDKQEQFNALAREFRDFKEEFQMMTSRKLPKKEDPINIVDNEYQQRDSYPK